MSLPTPFALFASVVVALTSAPIHSQPADVLNAAHSRCSAYGFERGTDGHANCVQRLIERIENAESREAQLERLRDQCWSAMFGRTDINPGASLGVSIANANRCNADPYAHLRK